MAIKGRPAPPVFHLLSTFHSSVTSSDEAPDLKLWMSDPRGDPPTFEIDTELLRPRSRGTLRLRSADPTDPPSIEFPGMRDPSDANRIAEAYQRGIEVAGHKDIRRLCPAASLQARSAEDLRHLIRANSYSSPKSQGPARWASAPATAR